MILLGVDGGGTRTTAVAATDAGEVLAVAVGDSINYYAVGMAAARDSMHDIVRSLEKSCGCAAFDGAFLGMSALSGPATPEEIARFADDVIPASRIGMDSDVLVALAAMRAPGACALAIAGTGSMAIFRDADGTVRTAGGWGYLLGDQGSAYHIALHGIQRGLKAFDGAADPTALTDALKAFYAVDSLWDLVPIFYEPPMPRNQLAQFAAQVDACAQAGDAAAIEILQQQARSLSGDLLALLRSRARDSCVADPRTADPRDLDPSTSAAQNRDPIPVGVYGGVFQHSVTFRAAFEQAVRSAHPGAQVRLIDDPPHVGALFCCMDLLGKPVTDAFVQRIRQTAAAASVG